MYPAAGHIMTGNLKIISDSRIRYIVSKGPKYRCPSRIDFKKCREEIASASSRVYFLYALFAVPVPFTFPKVL